MKKKVSVILTEPYLEAIEKLLSKGVYFNRTELFRDALRRLFRHHGVGLENDA